MHDRLKVARVQDALMVVRFPDEVDVTNIDDIGKALDSAFAPDVAIVIADMTGTSFCDSSAVQLLAQAHRRAAANGAGLRLAASSPAVLRIMAVTGFDQVIPVYPTLDAALGGLGDGAGPNRQPHG